MRKCEIVIAMDDANLVAGVVALEDGVLSASANPGYEAMMQEVLTDFDVAKGGDKIFPKDDPETWFNALPYLGESASSWGWTVSRTREALSAAI
jgi:hypothetical protein